MRALWRNASIATMTRQRGWGLITGGALVTVGATISWLGSQDEMPVQLQFESEHDLAGALVAPGLIDGHTHLVYAGDRSADFRLRLEGAIYEQPARRRRHPLDCRGHARDACNSWL